MNLKTPIDRVINWGDSLPVSPWQLAAVFAVTVIMRNLLEAITLGLIFPAPAFMLHFPVAYIFPLLMLVFVMRMFSGYQTAKLLKIMVLAWILTLLPPIIDKLAGTTSAIGYFPLERSNAAWFLLNFFNPAVTLNGTTTGIRVEAAIGCILAGVFTWAVAPNKRILRGVLNTLVFAPVFLSFFTWPYLIGVIFQPLFPGDGVTHSLLQWHAATEAPVTGASHFIVYLVDMIPVSLLSLWFVKELSEKHWMEFKQAARDNIPISFAAVLGTVAAFAVVPAGGLTMADTITITGALMASLWLVTAASWKGYFRLVASLTALTLAWASGWETLVFAGLAFAVSGLPGPKRLRHAVFAVALFVTALSPAGFSLSASSAVLSLLLIPVTVFLAHKRTSASALLVIPLAAVLISPPSSNRNAWERGLARRTDTFARSSRIGLALESAARLAAGGGPWLTLGETTHLTGQNERSRYVCETAIARGDSSASLMKVMMNLAFARKDTSEFNRIFELYTDVADESELSSAVNMRVSFLSLTGDTASLNYIHSRTGMNPMVLRSMATVHLTMGDTLRSLQYSMAFLDSPIAAAEDWAMTITLAAVTGEADWDSLYNEAEHRFGYCLPVMLARLRACVIATGQGDRSDLLHRCILIKPDNNEVLETAAMWFAAEDKPDSTLVFASRAIAGELYPSPAAFSFALNAALQTGNYTEAAVTARYAAYCYPGIVRNRAILAGILKARGDTAESALLKESFSGIQWAEDLCDSLESVVCEAEYY
ncbi:hypothetical protein DRQ21_04145 [Candidatus Fermentibacteria bacterium]|nr:MAG: hypothetical protein DRQ21_04145 [Candidatus Fermentibacteria bacterium]